MGRKRHKRKNNHVVILTSDATDRRTRQFWLRPWTLQMIAAFPCIVIGVLIGLFLYGKDVGAGGILLFGRGTIAALEQEKEQLQGQIAGLNGEIDALNEEIRVLNDTVAQKSQNESELTERLEKQSLPTEFPLTGKTTMEEMTDTAGNPLCVLKTSKGSMVVATARGSVIVVNEDPEYGNNIWVDHGNGYTTIYRVQGDVKVRQGETVTQGATLCVVTEDDGKLGYQIMKDNAYINPLDIMAING